MDIELLKSEVEEFLAEYFKGKCSYNKKIYEAMSYSLNIGGKRIRPTLFLLIYSMYRDNYKEVLPIAAAIEMIHTYSLIHDDLPCMDNDDLRRGKPTNHKVFGEAIAVLAGDGLLNEAMNTMFKFCMGKKENEIEACNIISVSAGAEGMIGGRIVDILSEHKKIGTDELFYMHNKKIGELIKASILSAAVLANAPDDEKESLKEFGEKLGLAFQIKDDILDVIGSKELMGKDTNSDVDNDKSNFISAYGLEKCIEICNKLTSECIMILDTLERNTSSLNELTVFLLKREF